MCVEGYRKVALKSPFTTRIDRIQEQVLLAMCALLFLEPEGLSHVFSDLILWAATFNSDYRKQGLLFPILRSNNFESTMFSTFLRTHVT